MVKDIDLYTQNKRKIYLKEDKIEELKKDLEYILEISDMNSICFVRRSLFGEEIKANNLVEDYKDDIEYIDSVVKENKGRKNATDEKSQRVLNLYNGYRHIMKGKDITKENLKELYDILSRNLLCKYDLEHMGEFYRNEMVYIYTSDIATKEPELGFEVDKIEEFMKYLFDYINNGQEFDSQVDYYIKSQIMHYYFVYIHPYFDVNGRTSRTLALWYLLNNEIYPFIIFNRGITYDKSRYYKYINDTKKYGDITIFIKYMLENVKKELVKEYGILEIEKKIDLNNLERQCINYIMAMKSHMTIFDFAAIYNRFNDPRKKTEIVSSIVEPLVDKKIIIPGNETKKKLPTGESNYFFELNNELLEEYNGLVRKLK